jgi:predicted regulator of Ras-like GTPase activity (Roadblock/LC7/MglB family)
MSMPKTQPKGKLEKTSTEDIRVSVQDLRAKENRTQVMFMRSKVKEDAAPERIRAVLDEMKTKDGVVGYILRNTKSATIDLNDPARMIDYAILSSSTKETGQEFSQTFDLGEVENVLVEGKNVKLLSLAIGENDISVLMDRSVDHKKILEALNNIS